MTIFAYEDKYKKEVFSLYNSVGKRQGFAELNEIEFDKLLIKEHSFVLLNNNKVIGFVCGNAGSECGYFTCLFLLDEFNNKESTYLLLDALEQSFKNINKTQIACTFFNPIKLPWIIPNTNNHLHNNCPGIPIDLPIYNFMLEYGYIEIARECALYIRLEDFISPNKSKIKDGYTIDWYNKNKHIGLKEMVFELGNPEWKDQIPKYAENINMLVVLKDNVVVGFAGPIYREDSGRGFFAGIGISKNHERNGLATSLFYRLCEEEKKIKAEYMSLFTGDKNHAKNIYINAGFEVKRTFAILIKEVSYD